MLSLNELLTQVRADFVIANDTSHVILCRPSFSILYTHSANKRPCYN